MWLTGRWVCAFGGQGHLLYRCPRTPELHCTIPAGNSHHPSDVPDRKQPADVGLE